jgi:hypothetical protein
MMPDDTTAFDRLLRSRMIPDDEQVRLAEIGEKMRRRLARSLWEASEAVPAFWQTNQDQSGAGKLQAPGSRLQKSFKLQTSKSARAGLKFEV